VADDRSRAAADRAAAAAGRARAARDRERAADDRKQAGRDRLQSQAERGKLLRELAITDTDRLTGGRAAGLADLGREIDRARRGTDELVVACVNVVAGNAVREADGDALLLRTVCAIRARLRSYDLIVGLEGNAFLCLISAATIQIVRQRFAAVQAALATDPDLCEIRVGVAALAPEDSAAELVKRAVAEMPSSRRPRFP
jgi:GGDEF domain-containing protein